MTDFFRWLPGSRANREARRMALREQRDATARMNDPAYLLKLYSANPALLKRALAAYQNVPVTAIAKLNVSDSSVLLEPLKRALAAFADGLDEVRSRAVDEAERGTAATIELKQEAV